MVNSFWKDSRTEWAIRWTVLHAIFYALFFFPPSTPNTTIDWSLPVQLISGGNLAFYNSGFHAWFGLGCCFAMAVGGGLLSIIYPLLQNDQLGVAYVILMAILIVMTMPFLGYIGILNNLTSIGILLVVIFTEIFYGPVLNFRSEEFTIPMIWTEIIAPNALPCFVYIALSWAVYAIPPWHSATYQMMTLSSQVVNGAAGCLREAAQVLRRKNDHNDNGKDDNPDINKNHENENNNQSQKETLQTMSTTLMQQTNYAGLYIPISLYGDMGIYEPSIFFPLASLRHDAFHRLGKYVDYTVFHIAFVLWALGEIIEDISDGDDDHDDGELLLQACADQLEGAGDVASCAATVIACPRKSYGYNYTQSTTSNDDRGGDYFEKREQFALNPKYYDVAIAGPDKLDSTANAKSNLKQAREKATHSALNLEETAKTTPNKLAASLLCTLLSDLTSGNRGFTHFPHDPDLDKEPGSLGRFAKVVEDTQESWSDKVALPRMLYRMTYMEQLVDLIREWLKGFVAIMTCQLSPSASLTSGGSKRAVGRALQYLVGTLGLYAMATWWEDYSKLLGNSSTGQWTMISFYVVFRSTVEETVNAGILRSIGHALGGLLSWGINSGVESNGGRMACHLAVTILCTWFIPPPFSVAPSSFRLPFDIIATNTLEGLMTTYHLTSIYVFATDIASAAQARMTSQCIGAGAAVVVSLLILPWCARPEATKSLELFHSRYKGFLESLDSIDSKTAGSSVENLLQARRDVASAQEAEGWIAPLLVAIRNKPLNDDLLGAKLTNASFGSLALEALSKRVQEKGGGNALPDDLTSALKAADLARALRILRESIVSEDQPRLDLASIYVHILLLQASLD